MKISVSILNSEDKKEMIKTLNNTKEIKIKVPKIGVVWITPLTFVEVREKYRLYITSIIKKNNT